MAIASESDGSVLGTTVSVKSGRKKLYDNKALVVEAFNVNYEAADKIYTFDMVFLPVDIIV